MPASGSGIAEVFVRASEYFDEATMAFGDEKRQVLVAGPGVLQAMEPLKGRGKDPGACDGGAGQFAKFGIGFGERRETHLEYIALAGCGKVARAFGYVGMGFGTGQGLAAFQVRCQNLVKPGIGDGTAGFSATPGANGMDGKDSEVGESNGGSAGRMTVAGDESLEAIERTLGPCLDEAAAKEVFQIGGQGCHGRITPVRFGIGGLVEDGAEIRRKRRNLRKSERISFP